MEPGLKTDLVGINVADTGKKILIDEQALESSSAAMKELAEALEVELHGFRAETLELSHFFFSLCLDKSDEPEFPGILKPKLIRLAEGNC